MKKSLLFGLLAVLAAVFIFTACDNGTTTEYAYVNVPVPGPETLIHIDTVAADENGLINLLADEDYAGKVIGIANTITLGADLDIPADYTVYLLNSGILETGTGGSKALTVTGTLWVGYGGKLSVPAGGADPIEVVEGGVVSVVTGGELSIQAIDDITNDGSVTITNGKLTVDGVADADELAAAFALVSSGDLVVTTAAADVKPSEAAGLAVSANKKVTIAASKTETAEALTIPAGLTLTASGDLSTVESFTVSGSLDTTGATLPATAINVTVGLDGSLTLIAALLGNSTVDGALVLGGDLTLDTGAVLAIADPSDVSGTDKIIADAGTITIGSVEGYTTTATGVVADDLVTALAALESDLAVVETYITLAAAFGTDPENAIGTVPITTDATATAVKDNGAADGTGDTVALDTGSEFEGTPTITKGGTDAGDVAVADFALTTNSGALEITDNEVDSSDGAKAIILTFTGLQIKNSGLITPAVLSAPFSIGVTTTR